MVGREHWLACLSHVDLLCHINGWIDKQLWRRPSIDVPMARYLIWLLLGHLCPVVPLTGRRKRLRIGDGLDASISEAHRRLLGVGLLSTAEFPYFLLRLMLADEARGSRREKAQSNEIDGLQIVVRALSDNSKLVELNSLEVADGAVRARLPHLLC